ncbi:MAG: methyl-accepting chemotaxis protein [Phycisphaerales bacterium]
MLRRLNSLSVKVKILGVTILLLLTVVGANYVVFMNGYETDAKAAIIEEAKVFTDMAEEAKNNAAHAITAGAIDLNTLIAEAQDAVAQGKSYTDTRFFNQIPVIVGWHVADKVAEREHLDFHVYAFEARNKKNEPEKGSFSETLLRDLTTQVKSGGASVMSRVDTKTNTMHTMRAIKLDATCMMCHGKPGNEWDTDKDGKDVLGFAMEGWDVGYMHGAYEVRNKLDEMDAHVASFFKQGMMFTVPLLIVSVLGFMWMTRKTLTGPLSRCVEVVSKIAKGDLTSEPLKLEQTDEIGVLAKSVDEMAVSLRSLVQDTQRTSTEVASAATEIAATSEEMAAGMQQQSSQTGEVSAAVTEMAASVQEVAMKSGRGRDVMEQMIREMSQIASEVNDSASAVGELGRKSEAIGQIVGVINDIADQTNLLALNAAIEAARAGEHGRGFAVVADEVRKLAERTTTATKEIAESIRGIQQETSSVVDKMEAGTKRVSEGVNLARSAGDALGEIVASTQEQAGASEQISRNMERITAVTRESSDGASQAASAASELSASAEQLQTLVGRFRI